MTAVQMPTISVYPREATSAVGKTANLLLPLSLGEMVEAVVGARTGESRFELTIKNGSLSAFSELPLARGDRLTVKVEQLQPQVILSIVQNEEPAAALLTRFAASSRANPEALKDIFLLGRDILSQASLLETLPETAKQIIAKIVNIFESLTFSFASSKEQFSIKNYLANLGLFLEFDLRQVVEGKKELNQVRKDSLKVLLQQLATELKAWQGRENSADNLQQISKMIEFSESALKTIEGHQALNAHSFSSEGNGFFQIPVFLPHDVRAADLFINTEQDKGEGGEGKKYSVAIFLNLDALGEMMVDASMAGGKLRCVFKFSDPEVVEFISDFMDDLEREIRGIGFGDVLLHCMHSSAIGKSRMDCFQDVFSDQEAINVFA